MYVPEHFAAEDGDRLLAELARARLAILVTAEEASGMSATHLPMLWDAERRVLEGHVARANPHHKSPAPQALVIFPGPDAYVSPGHYASKAAHGKVVPTWNYEAVHVSGAVEWSDDAVRLERIVRALTDRHEAGRAAPWSLDDAPPDYVRAMLRGIVGVTVRAERIEAKQKLSQNKSAADFTGVRDGLSGESESGARSIAARMRDLRVRE